jgi:hypothetical protein
MRSYQAVHYVFFTRGNDNNLSGHSRYSYQGVVMSLYRLFLIFAGEFSQIMVLRSCQAIDCVLTGALFLPFVVLLMNSSQGYSLFIFTRGIDNKLPGYSLCKYIS